MSVSKDYLTKLATTQSYAIEGLEIDRLTLWKHIKELHESINELTIAQTEAVKAEKRIWVDALLENLPEEKAVLFRVICASAEKIRAARAAMEGEDD